MNYSELVTFIVYLAGMLAVGVFFFNRAKGKSGDLEYFLGGRQMGPWVTALSAGASDMSATVFMGHPALVFVFGAGKIWLAFGMTFGYALCWIFAAPRLRKFTIAANDAITIPQYLANRFLSKNKFLQIICALIFMLAYTIYAASGIKACGTLINTVTGVDFLPATIISALIIVAYTFLGGFKAACWTDFIQGLLMLAALLAVPIIALALINSGSELVAASTSLPADYWSLFSGGKMGYDTWMDIFRGLGIGLGYFGIPHIIIHFMSLRSQREMKKSAIIGISWNVLIVTSATVVGLVGRVFLGDLSDSSLVFINMTRIIFPAVISGITLSAILAAAMSTADSQLLVAASSFASDIYKPLLRKGAGDKEMFWAGRLVVAIIAAIAIVIACNPQSGSIMELTFNAWGVFGAAFGPVILLSLFWKRFTYLGAVAGIIIGAAVDIIWLAVPALSGTGLYEIIPGFAANLITSVAVSLICKPPGKAVAELFEKSLAITE